MTNTTFDTAHAAPGHGPIFFIERGAVYPTRKVVWVASTTCQWAFERPARSKPFFKGKKAECVAWVKAQRGIVSTGQRHDGILVPL